MPQLRIFQALELEEKPQTSKLPKQSQAIAQKQIGSFKAEVETVIQSNPQSSSYGQCRLCSAPVAIPGLDASFFSNSLRSCGSSGWVIDPARLAANPQQGSEGGVQ